MAGIGTIFASLTAAEIAGAAFGVGSTLFTIMGQIAQGQAQKAAGEAQAVALRHRAALAERAAEAKEQKAGQERAVSQREAIEQRRRGGLVESRVQAISAASGAGALDPTIVGILGDIGRETDIRAETALFEGEEAARGLEFGAAIDRAGGHGDIFAAEAAVRAGRAARNRSFLTAGGTLFGGVSSKKQKEFAAKDTLLEGSSSLFDRFASPKDKRRFGFTEDPSALFR